MLQRGQTNLIARYKHFLLAHTNENKCMSRLKLLLKQRAFYIISEHHHAWQIAQRASVRLPCREGGEAAALSKIEPVGYVAEHTDTRARQFNTGGGVKVGLAGTKLAQQRIRADNSRVGCTRLLIFEKYGCFHLLAEFELYNRGQSMSYASNGNVNVYIYRLVLHKRAHERPPPYFLPSHASAISRRAVNNRCVYDTTNRA